MDTKVRILLDVDGVLNAVDIWDPPDWDNWLIKECNGFNILHSLDMGERIAELNAVDGVEILWLTTWELEANKWIAPLFGWPNFYLAGQRDFSTMERWNWWKFPLAKALWDKDQTPFVWLDDDLKWEQPALDWLDEVGDDALGISPDTNAGLTVAHMEQIEQFVASKL